MKFKKVIRGRALYTEENRIWVAQGMTFFAIDYTGKKITQKYKVGTGSEKLIGTFRLSRQLLRQGLHHLVPLPNGDVFVTAKKISYVVSKDGTVRNTFTGYLGNKPGHQGVCVTPDGTIFFGEYTLNMQRENDTHLYRSVDGGQSFQVALTLKRSDVRHIHFIKYDPYEKCIWLGTGDEDRENKLMRSYDNGDTWETVGEGSQDWRAIGVCFDKDSLIWGTDAGSVPDQNHIIRMDRGTNKISIIADAEGPCHGCGSFKDGRLFISTGVEGGENEKDRYARLKTIENDKAMGVMKCKKDIFPLILQYGVIRFPLGTENTDRVVYTTYGLAGNGECVYVEEK